MLHFIISAVAAGSKLALFSAGTHTASLKQQKNHNGVSPRITYLCPRIMKFYLGILLLLTACLVASPTGAVRAHSNAGVSHGQEEAASSAANDHCAPSTDDPCNDIHPGPDCPPDTAGCGHCHCPGCGVTGMTYAGFFKNSFVEMSAPAWLFDRRAANFCSQAPSTSPHLAALFRPPINKLG